MFPTTYPIITCHIGRELYAAGGWLNGTFSDEMKRINVKGEVETLKALPVAKSLFPMVYWAREKALITIGGSNGSPLTDVQQYSIARNQWNAIAQLPESMYGSSAAIIQQKHLYNIGGYGSTSSLMHLELGDPSKQWKKLNVASHKFAGWYYRGAENLGNRIVYFGS